MFGFNWSNWRHWALVPAWIVAIPVMIFFTATGGGVLVAILIFAVLLNAHESIDSPHPKRDTLTIVGLTPEERQAWWDYDPILAQLRGVIKPHPSELS